MEEGRVDERPTPERGEIAELRQRIKVLEQWAHEPFDFSDLIRRIEALEKGCALGDC